VKDTGGAPTLERAIPHLPEGGHVYFLSMHDGCRIKIGYSANLAGRLPLYMTHSPVELLVVGLADAAPARERELHKRLAGLRLHSEWFQSSASLWALIEEYRWQPGQSPRSLVARPNRTEVVAREFDKYEAILTTENDGGEKRYLTQCPHWMKEETPYDRALQALRAAEAREPRYRGHASRPRSRLHVGRGY
jgi:T5orf172 domain